MTENEIFLPMPLEHSRNIFGQFDIFAKKLERGFQVSIVNRDEGIKIIGNEKYFINKYIETYMGHADIGRKYNLTNMLPKYMIEMVCIVGIMVYFGYQIMYNANYLEIVPQLTVFVAAATKLLPSVNSLYSYFNTIMYHKAAIDLIYQDIKEANELDNGELSLDEAYQKMMFEKKISLKNLTFKYDKTEKKVLDNISFIVNRDDKIAFVGSNTLAATTLFKILMGELEPDSGSFKWGITTTQAYFPKDNTQMFSVDETIVDFLMPFSPEKDVTYVRGFLGRMLFAGEEGVKKVNVLSGGERVRCMLTKMQMSGANVLLLDEPTNHLDMESITALNNGMIKFPGVVLFTALDHQFIQTVANRIMEIVPGGKLIDKITTYDEYLESDEMARKRQTYTVTNVEDELGEEE